MIWYTHRPQRAVGFTTLFTCCALLLSCGWVVPANAQPFSHPNGLLLHADDVRTGQVSFGFDKGQACHRLKRQPFAVFQERWLLKTPDTSLRVSPATAWGYRLDGRTYRFGRSGSYEMTYAGDICLYRYRTSRNVHYFFSRGLDGPLKPLTAKWVRRMYADDPAVLQAVGELRWLQTPADALQPTGTVRVLTWFPS